MLWPFTWLSADQKMKKSGSHLTARPMLSLRSSTKEHARDLHSFGGPFAQGPPVNLSLHEIHANMEALHTRDTGQASADSRVSKFKKQSSKNQNKTTPPTHTTKSWQETQRHHASSSPPLRD